MPRPMREDLKAVPEDVRAAGREAEHKLEATADEHPIVREALDLRLLLVAAAVALLVAFGVRVAGAGFLISLVLFVVLFVGGWLLAARAAAPRRPTRPAGS